MGSQRSNLMTLMTDCPQRDERLGWLGDAQLSSESVLLNLDVAPLLHAWHDQVRSVTRSCTFSEAGGVVSSPTSEHTVTPNYEQRLRGTRSPTTRSARTARSRRSCRTCAAAAASAST